MKEDVTVSGGNFQAGSLFVASEARCSVCRLLSRAGLDFASETAHLGRRLCLTHEVTWVATVILNEQRLANFFAKRAKE